MDPVANKSYVHSSISAGVATIEFFTPQSNSLPGDILKDLAEQITAAGGNPEAKVIILKSAGDKAFCAGANFQELLAIQDERAGKAFFMGFANVINACRKAPKFVIGRVQGKAVGGGVGLAAAVDSCYATSTAEVKLSELAIGIGPFVVGPAIERKVGRAGLAELAMAPACFKTAAWAQQKGLYAEVFDSIQAMDDRVQAHAMELAKYNPDAMLYLKKILWQDAGHWDELLPQRAAISGELVLSDFTKRVLSGYKNL